MSWSWGLGSAGSGSTNDESAFGLDGYPREAYRSIPPERPVPQTTLSPTLPPKLSISSPETKFATNLAHGSTDQRVSVVDQKFREGINGRESDIFIAVMGVTGAGKSSFISLLCEKKIEIGHNLQACTGTVGVYACNLDPDKNIYLIDTPGFDDTHKSDTEVLREIAGWLTDSYSNNVKLNGIIYLHRISDIRMQGSAKKNLLMFKKLCGQDALKNVVLATSMWDRVSVEEGEKREDQLSNTPEFWGWMMSQGSRTFRHDNTKVSAQKLLMSFLGNDKMTLDIQQQMVNENKSLDQTGAGKELENEIAKEREKFAQELRDAQAQMKEALQLRDQESIKAIKELQMDYTEHMKRLEREGQELKISMERLHQERYDQLEAKMKKQQEELIHAQQEAHRKEIEALKEQHLKALRESQEALAKLELSRQPSNASSTTAASISSRLSHSPRPSISPRTTLQSQKRVRSTPGINRVDEHITICIHGTNFFFVGPAWLWWRAPKDCKHETWHRKHVLQIGEEYSWVARYEDVVGKFWLVYGGPFKTCYPGVWEKISDHQKYGPLKSISLGINGTYFARCDWTLWSLPKSILDDLDIEAEASKIDHFAFGKNDAYVLVRKDGSWRFKLNGIYPGLEEILQTRKTRQDRGAKIKAVALDKVRWNYYAVIFQDGGFWYRTDDEDHFGWQEWGTKNLGLTWD